MSTDSNDSTVREMHFEDLNIQTSSDDEMASATFDDARTTITGTIRGNSGCYTARLKEVVIKDDTLLVNIESSEDAEENHDCTQANVLIEYRATVETDGGQATAVEVEHNGGIVATEHRS